MRGLSTVSSGHFSEGHFRVTYELCTGGSLGRGMRPPGPPWPCSGPVLCRTGVALCCTGVAQELPLTPHQDKKNGPKPQRKPPKPSGTEQKIYFLLRVGGEPSYATPPLQILCKLAPPKTKSNGLTAAPRRKPFLVRFAPASWKRADSGPGSGSQFLNPRGATT